MIEDDFDFENQNSGPIKPEEKSEEKDVPPFDPEMAEKRKAEYKAEHPDAVDDIDKAWEMAHAGDKYETKTEIAKKRAAELRKQGQYAAADNAVEDAKFFRQKAHSEEEEAGKQYDADQQFYEELKKI